MEGLTHGGAYFRNFMVTVRRCKCCLKFLKFYPVSRSPLIFLDLSRKIEGPLLAGYLSSRKAKKISGYRSICLRYSEFFYSLSYDGGCVSHISLTRQFRYKDKASPIIFYKLRLPHFLELSTGPIKVATNFRHETKKTCLKLSRELKFR